MINFIKKYWTTVFLISYSLIPVFWFLGRGDILITGLDTNFPLNPLTWFLRRFFVWNGVNNAGVDFSSSTAGMFFHFIQVMPYLLGLSLKYVEIFSMFFWFSAIVFSAFFLARVIIPKSKISQLIFVTIYSFNTYLFNTWENVKVSNLSLVAALPLFVAVIYLWVNKKLVGRKAAIYLCIASILASGSGINPAYFLVIILTIVVETIVLYFNQIKDDKSWGILKIGIASSLILFLVNIFWALPLFFQMFGGQTKALSDIGFTDWLQSLSKNTSIINVTRLQGAWDWYALDSYGMPQYLPYTLNYLYNIPFIVFSFVVPLLSVLSFLFTKKENRFWYHYFGILALLGIFFGVGAHSPTGTFYLFLSQHLPFFSFFRSPWYIFTPILTLSYASLTGLFFGRLAEIASNSKKQIVFGILEILFLVSYLLYNYPLITGKIFRPDKDGFYIKFPGYVWESKNYLGDKTNQSDGRVISYPDDQLESFSWGYKGTESILGLFSDSETVTPSFNVASKGFTKIQELFYAQIKRKEYASAISLMNLLGADEIFYKKDVSSLSPKIGKEISDLANIKEIGEWLFMKVKAPINDKIFVSSTIYKNFGNSEDVAYVSSLFGPNTIIVNDGDTEFGKTGFAESVPIILKADRLGDLHEELSPIQKYKFVLPNEGDFEFAIERQFLNHNQVSLSLDGKSVTKKGKENDSLITIGPVKMTKGEHVLEIAYPKADNMINVSNFSSYIKGIDLRPDELPVDVNKTLVAYNSTNDPKKILLQTKNFNPFLKYAVGFDYKYVYGSVPFVDLLQSAPTSPVKTESLYPGSSVDWGNIYKIFNPVETESKLELLIKMSPNKPGDKSKSYFENIFIKRIYDNKVFIVEEDANQIKPVSMVKKIDRKSPVKYQVEIDGNGHESSGIVIAFLESYNKNWDLKFVDGKGLNVEPIHFSINGYANGWYIPDVGNTKLTIYYKSQNIYILGLVISLLTIFSIFVNFFFGKNKLYKNV